MSAPLAAGRRGPVASAIAAVSEWLVEPAGEVAEPGVVRLRDRAAVAVVGLGPRSGATTVARALGAELARRDPDGACAVTAAPGSVVPLGTPAAGRLARVLAPVGVARACGRLCLVDAPDRAALADFALTVAPLVFDVEDPAEAAAASALSRSTVLVGGPQVEPALATAMASSLARVGPRPKVVASRPGEGPGWEGRADIELPHSRMAAQLALAGREARGELGLAIEALADLLEQSR